MGRDVKRLDISPSETGTYRISYGSQFTISNMAGTSTKPVCNYTHMRSPEPIPASRTPDFSYPLILSPSSSSLSPNSLFLVHTFTINEKHKVQLSLFISPSHDHELTPSTVYTEYKHTPFAASAQDCLATHHSHDHKLTPECSIRFWHSSLQHCPHKVAFNDSSRVKSRCHIPMVASLLTHE
jgi:hypothetical protein